MTGPDRSDEALQALLQRCALEESEALRALYDAVSPKLYGLLKRILGQPDRAEDALQEVFIRIWHGARYYHPERGKAMTWMYSVARYHAYDLARKSGRDVPVVEMENLAEQPSDDDGDFVSDLSRDNVLNYCLHQLTEEQKKCIEFAYLQGYTRQDLSAALQTPLNTVKTWIRRGLQALRKCIENAS